MKLHKRVWTLLSILVVASMILTACAAPAAAPRPSCPGCRSDGHWKLLLPRPQPPKPPPRKLPLRATSDRAKTLIMDIDGGRIQDPELWNPFVPGNRQDQGYHQVCEEPLFILNYQTGEIMPWLAESFTANETNDVWTLKLRDGVTWQDGEAFNADDVVFTIQMLLDNSPELNDRPRSRTGSPVSRRLTT